MQGLFREMYFQFLIPPAYFLSFLSKKIYDRHQWLMPVIPPTQEERLGGSWFETNPGQIVHKTVSGRNPSQKAGNVAQGVGPELKSQYHKKKKKNALK
jgi:hypothetical protein